MKKAFLVTFEVTTRVVVDVDADPDTDDNAYNDIVSAAVQHADFTGIGDNVTEIVEDGEMPYGTHPEDK